MDPRVIDLPTWKRRLVVNMILIRRPKASGEAYEKVWTDAGVAATDPQPRTGR